MPNPRCIFIPEAFRSLVDYAAVARTCADRGIALIDDLDEYALALPMIEYLLTLGPPRGLWHTAERLRLVQTLGTGVDSLYPLDGLRDDVVIANSAGVNAHAVAEAGLALALFMRKGLARLVDAQRDRRWAPTNLSRTCGSTMVILGCGRIGRILAAMAAPLGIIVLGTHNKGRRSEPGLELHASDETSDLIASADILVSLLPYTPHNDGFLSHELLSRLSPGAVFVNLGRGGVVDEAAIVSMLRSGRLAGAAMDVFRHEPLPPESDVWDCPGLIVTPHVAGAQDGHVDEAIALFLVNIADLEAGRPVPTAVERARGY